MQKRGTSSYLQKFDFALMWLLLCGMAWLVLAGVIATSLLLLGDLSWGYMLLIGVPLGTLVAVCIYRIQVRHRTAILPDGLQKQRLIAEGLLLLMVLAWGFVNIHFTSQHVFVNRDPGIYAVGALHLSKHDDLDISSENIFGAKSTVESSGSEISSINNKELYLQGLHLLPAFLGLGGKIVGSLNALKLNIVFGMTALIAVYLFATRLVRPYWALVASALFAVSMPLLYFSRDTYSEPLAASFTFAAMAFLWLGTETRSKLFWLLAGLSLGASTLTRIDGYIVIAAALFFVCFYVATARSGERKKRSIEAGMFMIGAALTGILGWLDLLLLSSGYFFDLYGRFLQEIAAIGLGVAGIIGISITAWRTNILEQIDKRLQAYYRHIIVLFVTGTALTLVSRQFWDQTHGTKGLQNFNEFTALWPGWYMGDVLIYLSLAGMMLALYKLLVKKEIRYLIPASVIILTSLLYLVKPNIAPDQIWASRRLVPVILPGLIVFAVLTIDQLYKRLEVRYKLTMISRNGMFVATAAFLVLAPLSISRPMLIKSQYTQAAILQTFCEKLPPHAAVLWLGTARNWALQSSEELCGIRSAGLKAGYVDSSNLKEISRSLEQRGLVPIVAVFGGDLSPDATLLANPAYQQPLADKEKPAFKLVSSGVYNQLEASIIGAPKFMSTGSLEIYAARLKDDKFVRL